MEIAKRVKQGMEEIKAKHGSVPAGTRIEIGHKESEQVEMEATTKFFLDRMQGNENLYGLRIFRVGKESHFELVMPEK